MIQIGTYLNISDNSGAKKAKCIKIFGSKKKVAYTGDLIRVSIKRLRSSKRSTVRVKKGEICNAVIIRSKNIKNKKNIVQVNSISFLENSIVLLNKQFKLIGSRVIGPVPSFFKQTKFSRLSALSFTI